jgi:hypothetical protein
MLTIEGRTVNINYIFDGKLVQPRIDGSGFIIQRFGVHDSRLKIFFLELKMFRTLEDWRV